MKKLLKAVMVTVLLLLTLLIFFFCGLVINRWNDSGVGLSSLLTPYIKVATIILCPIGFLITYYLLGNINKIKDKKPLRLLFTLFIPWLSLFILFGLTPKSHHGCDIYTEEMNGGIKIFNGKQYKIELCGLNGDIDPGTYDEIRLRVFSMNGELLAERFFEFNANLMYVEYKGNHVAYNDDPGKGFNATISMPPSRWDWVRARLPRMWP